MQRNIIGVALKNIRLKRQPPITQNDLAARLQILGWKITRFGISKIERGERKVTDKEILLLSQALNVSVQELFQEIDL